ncbi:SpoIIE family protein phosphatase [Actinosynnema sp. NPDC050436]|uniref:SpoIIE family protein phosphatase n=1 Tax=Actinosynnema sp. NPDC050436 TaxID=3155659 RepID=UPI0033EDA6FF
MVGTAMDGAGGGAAGSTVAALRGFEHSSVPLVVFGKRGETLAVNAVARAFLSRDVSGRSAFDVLERPPVADGKPFRAREWLVRLVDADGVAISRCLDLVLVPVAGGVLAELVDVTPTGEGDRRADSPDSAQRALLPLSLPVVPGVELGAGYLPAEREVAAGGDWFDAFVVGHGRVALVVGDVVGHGVSAAAVMGQLRAVLCERLSAGRSPAEALSDLDAFAARVPGARVATACVAVLDPVTGELVHATAGHPPPLVLSPAGHRFLAPAGGGPLVTGSRYRESSVVVGEGGTVLLYTDGAVERPGRTPAQAEEELAELAGARLAGPVAGSAGRLCGYVVDGLVAESGYSDDVTVLVARRRPVVAGWDARLPSVLGSIGVVRRGLAGWLGGLGLDAVGVLAVQHAVGEVVTNAVEHAHPDSAEGVHEFRVEAELTADGRVVVTVADDGAWRRPVSDPHRGLGLAMAADLVDELVVTRGPGGTTVRVVAAATRPAQVMALPVPARQAEREPEPYVAALTADDAEATLVVRGAVDVTTAPDLRDTLLKVTAAGAASRRVDLAGVTLLASAGVSALHEASGRCSANSQRLTCTAPPGSVAHHVLDLVALLDPDER